LRPAEGECYKTNPMVLRRVVPSFLYLLLASTAIAQSASILIEKTGSPNPVIAGSDITYTIGVSSEGPDDALNVAVVDSLPAGTTFASLVSPAGWNCTTPAPNATGTINCTIPVFSPGSSFFTLVVHTDPSLTNGSTISNTATLTTTTADPDANDNISTATIQVEADSDLGITKSASPNPAVVGGPITFTLGYTASGPNFADAVTITDALPVGVNFTSVAASGFTCTTPAVGTNGTVTCTANASLAPGASGAITIVGQIDPSVVAGTTITNTATISGNVVDANSANDSASASVNTVLVADLTITKSDSPDPVAAGATLTYSIGYANAGPSPQPNVAINDTLPTGTTFSSLTTPGGWSCTTPPVGGTGAISCSKATLAAGENGTLTLLVTVDPNVAVGTTLSNTATISSTPADTPTSNNSATTTTTVTVPGDLSVTKSGAPNPVTAGAQVTWTINWALSGPSNAPSVTITDAMPAGTTFSSITAPGWTYTTGSNVSCSRGPVTTGSSGTITIVADVDPAVAAGTTITNTAVISGSITDTNNANDNGSASVTTTSVADLGVTIGDSPDPVTPNSPLTYIVTVTRTGTSNAANAQLTVALSPLAKFASLSSPAGWSCTTPAVGATGTVTCTNASFGGASAPFTINTTTSPALTNGGTITTTAQVSTTSTDSNAGNNNATATTTGLIVSTVDATKSVATQQYALEGTPVTYTIVLTHSGPVPQADNPGDELTDVLPAGLVLISASATSGVAVADIANNTVHWNGSIAANGSVTITIDAKIAQKTAGTTISNQATIHYDRDGNGTNETTDVSHPPAGAGATTFAVIQLAGANGIPTLSTWMMLVMAMMLAGAAAIALRA
jgi:uncharacterized repeat protein (TIGR01451 family)